MENFTQQLHNITNQIQKLMIADTHALIERMIILFVYAIVAWVVYAFVIRALRKAASKTRIPFDDFLLNFIQTPLVTTIFLLGVLNALSLEPTLKVPFDFIATSLVRSLIIAAWAVALLKSMNRLDEKNVAVMLRKKTIDRDLFYLFRNVSRILVVFTGILSIMVIWGVQLGPIFASAGVAGIAIALAAKDTLANFFGGISIFMDKSYKVGEYIVLDSGERGEVVEVGIRSTKMKTRDDILITIPNAIMSNSKIVNQSAPSPPFRIRIDVGVAYGSDLDQVENVLMDIALNTPSVVTSPEPRVRVRELGDSSVNLQLLCWVEDPRARGSMTHQLIKDIYKTFNELNIEIPFPQRDINFKNSLITEETKGNTSAFDMSNKTL